jgi:hypothetical protein
MKQVYLLSIIGIFILTACGEDLKERDRKIKQTLMKMADGVPCVSLSVTPDSANKEVLVAIGIMEDSSRIEALLKKDDASDGYIGRETFGSLLARDMSNNIGMRVIELSMQKADEQGTFKGKALLKTGEKISFIAHPEKGWYPENDLNILQTITKYQIIKNLEKGKELIDFSIAPENTGTYRGKYTLKSGEEQWVYIVHTGEGFTWNLSEAYTPPSKQK